jgi:hypothetical protein
MKALGKAGNPFEILKSATLRESLRNCLQSVSSMEIPVHPCVSSKLPPRLGSQPRYNVRASLLQWVFREYFPAIDLVEEPGLDPVNLLALFVGEVGFDELGHPCLLQIRQEVFIKNLVQPKLLSSLLLIEPLLHIIILVFANFFAGLRNGLLGALH